MRIKIIITYIFMTFLYSCNSQNNPNSLIKCYIYPTGTLSKTYEINVFDNGLMQTSLGERSSYSVEINKIQEKDKVFLTNNEFEELKSLITKLQKLDTINLKEIRKGGWIIDIKINKKEYKIYNGEHLGFPIDELMQIFKKLSPIKIELDSNS